MVIKEFSLASNDYHMSQIKYTATPRLVLCKGPFHFNQNQKRGWLQPHHIFWEFVTIKIHFLVPPNTFKLLRDISRLRISEKVK